MAYGDPVSKPYTGGGAPTDSLAARDLGRTAVAGLTPMVQEVTHEITGWVTLPPRQVTTAGTRVRLNATSLPIRRALIVALPTNQGRVVLGDASVVAAVGTQAAPTFRGFPLNTPGVDWFATDFANLMDIWLDAVYSGDGVAVTYLT